MESQLKERLKARTTWVRGLYMLLFAVLCCVAGALLAVVVLFQFGSRLITGGANSRLLEFSEGLAGYIHQIIRFLCFNSDEHPYPLGAWPQAAAPAKSDSTTRTATRSTRSRKKSPPPAPPVEEQPEGSTDG